MSTTDPICPRCGKMMTSGWQHLNCPSQWEQVVALEGQLAAMQKERDAAVAQVERLAAEVELRRVLGADTVAVLRWRRAAQGWQRPEAERGQAAEQEAERGIQYDERVKALERIYAAAVRMAQEPIRCSDDLLDAIEAYRKEQADDR